MKDLYVSWDEYHGLIEQLALSVHESGWRFDSLLCLARGGLRVGDVVSRIYDMPLAILAASSYRAAAGKEQGSLDIGEFITMTGGALGGNLLLLDDLVDSGVTLTRVIDHLQQRYPAITEVRTGVLWYKACSAVSPRLLRAAPADEPVDPSALRGLRCDGTGEARGAAEEPGIAGELEERRRRMRRRPRTLTWCPEEDSNLHASRR